MKCLFIGGLADGRRVDVEPHPDVHERYEVAQRIDNEEAMRRAFADPEARALPEIIEQVYTRFDLTVNGHTQYVYALDSSLGLFGVIYQLIQGYRKEDQL